MEMSGGGRANMILFKEDMTGGGAYLIWRSELSSAQLPSRFKL
jgi:hypothetical protein